MNLEQYFCKKVRVVDIDGIEYVGKVNAFTYAKDNGDVGEDSIAIFSADIELAESEIKSIEVIEDE
ncbi:MAG: hypothetical protein LUG91_05055 [Ruminococcus sp.]|nr:hypothetical protein [Ruminococcus sp.]